MALEGARLLLKPIDNQPTIQNAALIGVPEVPGVHCSPRPEAFG